MHPKLRFKRVPAVLGLVLSLALLLSACTTSQDNKEDPLAKFGVDTLLPFDTAQPTATPTISPTATLAPEATVTPASWWDEEPPEDEEEDDPPVRPTKKPTEKPTRTPKPTAKPTNTPEPTDEPTEKPTDKPTSKPTDKPTEKPADPTEKPADPTEKPADPTEKPADPTEKPADPTEKPADPTEKPADPTEAPTEEATEAPIETPEPEVTPTAEPEVTEAPTEAPPVIDYQGNKDRQNAEIEKSGGLQINVTSNGMGILVGDLLYFTDGSNGNTLHRKTPGQDDDELVNEDNAFFLHSYDGALYYVADQRQIVKLTDETHDGLFTADSITGMSMLNDTIYFIADGNLYSMPISGGETRIASDVSKFMIDVTGKQIIVISNDNLVILSLDGSASQTLAEDVKGFALGGNNLYYTDGDSLFIMPGFETAVKLVEESDAYKWLGVYKNTLYYTNSEDQLYKADLDGTNAERLVKSATFNITFVGNTIYYGKEPNKGLVDSISID